MNARVVIVQESLPDYRVDFFSRLQEVGRSQQIAISVAHGSAQGARAARVGRGNLAGGHTALQNHYLNLPRSDKSIVWQEGLLRALKGCDLAVFEQGNRLAANQLCLLLKPRIAKRVAFFGHGRDMQINSRSASEEIKKWLARHADYWFAYTDGVADYLCSIGIPRGRVTSVGNTIDVITLQQEIDEQRNALGDSGGIVGLYIGGLYAAKRLDLLMSSCDLVRSHIPNFELVIAGAGEEEARVREYASHRSWVTYEGHVHGAQRHRLLARARVILMPGPVGLVALDAFAASIPIVTLADSGHGPEAEYLQNGVNSVVLPTGVGYDGYAAGVVQLLCDERQLRILGSNARNSVQARSLEPALDRFLVGIKEALNLAPVRFGRSRRTGRGI